MREGQRTTCSMRYWSHCRGVKSLPWAISRVLLSTMAGSATFFEGNGSTFYPWPWDRLRPQLDDRPADESGVLLVDMKRRCLVGSSPQDACLFSGILNRFLDPQRWGSCRRCVAQHECPIWFNVQSLSDTYLKEPIRRRLHRLLLAIHLRRERRATVRDLRSALAFLITHDLGCRTIHEERAKGQWPLADASRYYFNAAFHGSGGPDLLLDEWQQIDPALVPTPRLDRYLHFHRTPDQSGQIEAIFQQTDGRPSPAMVSSDSRERIAALKRRYAFESNSGPDAHRRQFPAPDQLIPYRYLDDFVSTLTAAISPEEIGARLLAGISRADGVPMMEGAGLALRLTDASNDELVVIKKYPSDEFHVRVPVVSVQEVEILTDYLVLEHLSGSPRLIVGLDLFEYLCRACDGFIAGSEEQRRSYLNLGLFKNQLLTKPTQGVLILEAGHKTHQISIQDGIIIREEAAV